MEKGDKMSIKKYQVFISSTYVDLIEERRSILDILLMADCIPAGMEAFVATDDEQFEVIKKVIDLCDYYVLIIGKRYGSVNDTTGKSYTEMEYEYAKEKNIPVLVFAIDNTVELPPEKTEQVEENIVKLHNFRRNAMTNRLASIWKNIGELTGQLAVSIMTAKNQIDRPGWQRAFDFDEASLRRELMELKTQNENLIIELKKANNTIDSFKDNRDIAFDDVTIKIPYHYYVNNNRKNWSKEFSLKELFKIVATEMMDVTIPEVSIKSVICNHISESSIFLDDSQLIKRILNQFRALGLLYSNWSNDKSSLYWGLTIKGEKIRNDMILIKKESGQLFLEELICNNQDMGHN